MVEIIVALEAVHGTIEKKKLESLVNQLYDGR